MKAKNTLINLIKNTNSVSLDPNVLTIGFARRATGYKRSTLIFSRIQKLIEINNRGKIQMVFAGKAHQRSNQNCLSRKL